MTNEELKELLNSKNINSWPYLYKQNIEIRDILSIYNIIPKTDKDIFKLFYLFMNSYTEEPKAYCGKPAVYSNYKNGFYKVCSDFNAKDKNSCKICTEMRYKSRTENTKKSNLEKYGVENISQIQSIKDKKEKTCIEKFGASTNLKTKETKDKIKNTNRNKFGTDYPLQNTDILLKQQNTNIKRYGVKYQGQREEVKNKIKETNLKIRGVPYVLQDENIRSKIKDTNMKKYGASCIFSTQYYKEIIINTNIKKYNALYPMQNSDILNKRCMTNNKLYGGNSPSCDSSVLNKMKNTTLERYGVEYYSQSDEYKIHIQDSLYMERYDIISTNIDYNYIPLFDEDDLVFRTNMDLLPFWCNYCDNLFYSKHKQNNIKCNCQIKHGVSIKELELRNYIMSLIPDEDIIFNDRTILKGKELDIYIPNLNLAFEFNGMYWHSDNIIDKNKHQNKVLQCKEQGINLIHVFEDEWDSKNELIKNRIKSKLNKSPKIYARKCTVGNVDNTTYKDFCNLFHIQGYTEAKIKIGLYYDYELVAVMSFGAPRNKSDKIKYEYELIRYCSDGSVIGGASKILKYFEKKYKPKSLMSYADMNWSNGNLYSVLGFTEESYTKPGYFYYNKETNERISRQRCQKHKLVKLGYDSNLTETTICCDIIGYLKIYDSGNLKYVKKYQ